MKTAEEWGRVAVSLPGWQWMRGMTCGGSPVDDSPFLSPITDEWLGWWVNSSSKYDDVWPDPDDPATAGCLLALLGFGCRVWQDHGNGLWTVEYAAVQASMHATLGRACIAAAATFGQWPGGEE